jgi:hypothetical protein
MRSSSRKRRHALLGTWLILLALAGYVPLIASLGTLNRLAVAAGILS